jgi:4-hydroxybenzoate polyprenyltransferase
MMHHPFLEISRAKIQLATLPHALLGLFLALRPISFLHAFVYVLLYFVMITFACNVNALYDFHVDRKYKTYMSDAILKLGFKRVRFLVILELMSIIALIAFFLHSGYQLVGALALSGLFFSIAYSVPPLRLKARGFLSALPVFLGLYTLPVLGGWFLLRTDFPFYVIIFACGYASMNEGITLVNTCEDYSEDKSERIKTWAHFFGIKNALNMAATFAFLGGFLSFLSLLPTASSSHLALLLLFLFALSVVLVSREILAISFSETPEQSCKEKAGKMPLWFAMTRYTLLITAIAIYASAITIVLL